MDMHEASFSKVYSELFEVINHVNDNRKDYFKNIMNFLMKVCMTVTTYSDLNHAL